MKLTKWVFGLIGILIPLTVLATRAAPDAIRRCPKCAELFRERQWASGNNMGAVMWTDGKYEAPMLPDEPRLVKCRKCNARIWVKGAELVGEEATWMSRNPEWKGVEGPVRLDENDFLAEAAGLSGEPDKEKYARLRAWWLRNDPMRHAQSEPGPWTAAQKENLLRLKQLLDAKDADQRLMQAEIERELGRFEACLEILESGFPEEYSRVVAFIRQLATEKKTDVAQFPK